MAWIGGKRSFVAALGKLPVILPFALATIVGGIDCTESAAAVGDDYDTRSILLTEGVASLVAGLLGGVIQTTPYIGHPAYKKMGGRAAYTLATALFIGVAGYFGWFTLLYHWLPKAAMFPILVFVGLEITAQSFQATPARHYPALAFAMLPALAVPDHDRRSTASSATCPPCRPERMDLVMQTLYCLSNGFIITGMLWAAALAMIIDGRLRWAAGLLRHRRRVYPGGHHPLRRCRRRRLVCRTLCWPPCRRCFRRQCVIKRPTTGQVRMD